MMGMVLAAVRRTWTRVAIALTLVLAAVPLFAQPPSGATPDGFVPVSQLPPAQRMPAAPLLIAAYAFVWLALLVYLWTIWRRLGRVEGELKQLDRQ
ncbi:MAG TPA: CcmD family protein [Vicinamibacterales bacterium]|nr:CcmD family protein [Vicinamibacterales bacterium]